MANIRNATERQFRERYLIFYGQRDAFSSSYQFPSPALGAMALARFSVFLLQVNCRTAPGENAIERPFHERSLNSFGQVSALARSCEFPFPTSRHAYGFWRKRHEVVLRRAYSEFSWSAGRFGQVFCVFLA